MKLYNIVVCGEILPNYTQDQVQENLIRFLKIPDHFAPKFLLKNRINFKKAVSIEETRKYLFALEKCGLQGHLEEAPNEETQSQHIDTPSLTTKTPLKPKEQRLMMSPSGASLDSLGLMSDEEATILSEANLTAEAPVKSKGQSIEVSGATLGSLGLMSDEESQVLSEATLTIQAPIKSKGQSINLSGSSLDSLGLMSDEESQVLSEADLTVEASVKPKDQSIVASNQENPTLSELSLMLDEQDATQKKLPTTLPKTALAPIELGLVTHEPIKKPLDQQSNSKESPNTFQQPYYQAGIVSDEDEMKKMKR